MNRLWLGFAAIAAYGSIYPFDFQFRQLDPVVWQAFIDTCCRETSRGDILGNVVLFLPYGYLGILAAGLNRGLTRQFFLVCITGVVFAFLLQVAQLYLPRGTKTCRTSSGTCWVSSSVRAWAYPRAT